MNLREQIEELKAALMELQDAAQKVVDETDANDCEPIYRRRRRAISELRSLLREQYDEFAR
jgi:hypothetical protein